jgi:Tol biopolymer transport system component
MYVKFPEAEALRRSFYTYALSADGATIVYVGPGEGGSQLWLKPRAELHATPLAGTSGATNPFMSPDGKWIGFVADGKLKKVSAAGGSVLTVANAACDRLACSAFNESGSWLDDGRIVYQSRGAVMIVPESGGTPDTLVRSADVLGFGPMLPVALPGSRGIVFNACTLGCNKSDIWVTDLRTKKTRRLVENATFPRYSVTGHLLYSNRSGSGFVVPFDLARLEITGPPTPILEGVAGNFALSTTGTLLYLEGDANPRSELVLVGRDGQATSIDSTWRGNFGTLALSPDGKKVAASIFAEGQEHIWIKPIAGGAPSRLTFGTEQNTTPTWAADGQALFYTWFKGDSNQFLTKRADGTGTATSVRHAPAAVIESVVSRDGEWLVLREYRNGSRDIYAMRPRLDSIERPIVANAAEDYSPALSPDGKWLAYASEESGRTEVWVVPFPEAGGSKWQVSTQGGWEPIWSHGGRELFFVNGAREMTVAEVSTTPTFTVGQQRTLFSVEEYRRHATHRAYDLMPDDQHFLMIRGGPTALGDLVIVDNWFEELKAKLKK